MIKDILYKAFSFTLALLVLVSTMSFTIEKHYCGNSLVDTAVFAKVKGCAMDMYKSQTAEKETKHCCKNEVELIKGQDKLKIVSFENLKFHQQLFFTSFVYSFGNLFEGLPEQVIPHKNYSPPNLVADIQVLDQVFII
nr:hypothetical protein [Confluentibacter sediminis]